MPVEDNIRVWATAQPFTVPECRFYVPAAAVHFFSADAYNDCHKLRGLAGFSDGKRRFMSSRPTENLTCLTSAHHPANCRTSARREPIRFIECLMTSRGIRPIATPPVPTWWMVLCPPTCRAIKVRIDWKVWPFARHASNRDLCGTTDRAVASCQRHLFVQVAS